MESGQFSVRLSDGQTFGPAGMPLLVQWAREGRIPRDAMLVPADGGPPCRVADQPALAAIVLAPPTISTGLQTPQHNAPALIPYRNAPALVGYYLSVFSLLAGPVLGIPAVILGVIGIQKRRKEPAVKGLAHAWVAIVLGGLITLVWFGVIVSIFVVASKR